MDERVEIATQNIRVEAAAAEVLRAFAAGGVEGILLKGPAIGRWLYSDAEPRSYRDCDLLIGSSHAEAAAETLAAVGFERIFDQSRMPPWWREHAGDWWRADDGVVVDLHRTLAGVGVDDDTAWALLSLATDTMPVAGHPSRVLGVPARALHIALHAAQHGVGFHQPMVDLERALEQVGDPTWRAAAELAAKLEATAAFAVGLRLKARGRDLVARLELSAQGSVEATLRATTPPPVALGFEQLAQADGLLRKAEIVCRKFVPPAAFVRRWHPMASRGRLGLVRGYLWRPFWILRNTPRAARAWLRARRDSARD